MKRDFSYYRKLIGWNLTYYRPKHDATFETKNGLLTCSSKDWLIGKHLSVRREFEFDFIESSIELLRREKLLKPGDNNTVVDIGANIGMIAIALLREKYFAEAIAFEPFADNFRLLEKNVSQNNLTGKIHCFQLALSSADTDSELEIDRGNSGDCRVKMLDDAGAMNEHKRPRQQIKSTTFDSFLNDNKQFDESQIDLLWMDIQGHEGHFFKGAREFLKRRKIPCICEFWSYGIERAGMSRNDFAQIVGESFTKFYWHNGRTFELNPLSEIEILFEQYKNPRQGTNIILI